MAPARTQKEETNSAVTRALRELRYTLVATGLIVVLGLGFYLFLPSLGKSAGTEKSSLDYKRMYSYFAWGAELEYQALSDRSKVADKARLKQDLEILARRFGRRDFNIISLPGIKGSPQYQKVLRYQALYGYKVKAKQQGAVLEIRVSNQSSQAVQALHEYLRYLEKNWRA